MITLTYDPINGIAIPDGMVETEYKNIMRLENTGLLITSYSTDNIFAYVRLQIALDKLDYNDVQFWYNDMAYSPNCYGEVFGWPEDFFFAVTHYSYMQRLSADSD